MTDGAQVEIVFALGTEVIENRLWFWNDTPPFDLAALQGLSDGVYAWHTSRLLPYLSSDLQLAAVEAKRWDVSPPVDITVSGPPINGGVVEQSHSANVAAVVPFKWPINAPRLKKNKNYVPGLPLSAVNLNTITPAYQSILFEAYVALIDDTRLFAPIRTWNWVAASAFSNNAARTEQLQYNVQGVPAGGVLVLGQRRKRLSIS